MKNVFLERIDGIGSAQEITHVRLSVLSPVAVKYSQSQAISHLGP